MTTGRHAENEFEFVYEKLMPALARASVGDFGAEVDLDRENSVKVNELLMGVSVLLEVIREQQRELEKLRTSLPLLDEVLGPVDKS